MRRTLAKFGLPFEKATPLEHFPKALKRPRNNAGPASVTLTHLDTQVSLPHLDTHVTSTHLDTHVTLTHLI